MTRSRPSRSTQEGISSRTRKVPKKFKWNSNCTRLSTKENLWCQTRREKRARSSQQIQNCKQAANSSRISLDIDSSVSPHQWSSRGPRPRETTSWLKAKKEVKLRHKGSKESCKESLSRYTLILNQASNPQKNLRS